MSLRTFKLEKKHAQMISKSTLFRALEHLDREDVDTPFLLIDTEKVREKVATIGRHIPNAKVFYSVKANPDPVLSRLIAEQGMGFEIASEGELRMLAALGVKPERIISSNPVKSLKFLEKAHAYGVNSFAFDSFDEIEKMAKWAPRAEVYVRLSVPNEGSEWPLSQKFGAELDEAAELLAYAKVKRTDAGRRHVPRGLPVHPSLQLEYCSGQGQGFVG